MTCWPGIGMGPRYRNYTGKVIIWDDTSVAATRKAIGDWMATGQVIADKIGLWDKSSLPPLAADHARVMVLTPEGLRFGQGPQAALGGDPLAGRFLSTATNVMLLLVNRAVS